MDVSRKKDTSCLQYAHYRRHISIPIREIRSLSDVGKKINKGYSKALALDR